MSLSSELRRWALVYMRLFSSVFFPSGSSGWSRNSSRHTSIEATGVFNSWFMMFVSCFFNLILSCSCLKASRCCRSRCMYSLTIWPAILPSSSLGKASSLNIFSPFSAFSANGSASLCLSIFYVWLCNAITLITSVIAVIDQSRELSACKNSFKEWVYGAAERRMVPSGLLLAE